jgi:hypothetical protein
MNGRVFSGFMEMAESHRSAWTGPKLRPALWNSSRANLFDGGLSE